MRPARRSRPCSGACLVEELIEGPEVTVNAFSAEGTFHPLTVTDRLTAEPPAFGVALARLAGSPWGSGGGRGGRSRRRSARDRERPHVHSGRARPGRRPRRRAGRPARRRARCRAVPRRPRRRPERPRSGGSARRGALTAPQGSAARAFASSSRLRASCQMSAGSRTRAQEGVVDVRVYRRPGWTFGPLRRGADRAGFVLATGDPGRTPSPAPTALAQLVQFVTADAEVVALAPRLAPCARRFLVPASSPSTRRRSRRSRRRSARGT